MKTVFCLGLVLTLLSDQAHGQKERGYVYGYVYDRKTNEPLFFANVVVEQSGERTFTHDDGHFVVPLNGPTAVLDFFCVQYKVTHVSVKAKDTIIVRLDPSELITDFPLDTAHTPAHPLLQENQNGSMYTVHAIDTIKLPKHLIPRQIVAWKPRDHRCSLYIALDSLRKYLPEIWCTTNDLDYINDYLLSKLREDTVTLNASFLNRFGYDMEKFVMQSLRWNGLAARNQDGTRIEYVLVKDVSRIKIEPSPLSGIRCGWSGMEFCVPGETKPLYTYAKIMF